MHKNNLQGIPLPANPGTSCRVGRMLAGLSPSEVAVLEVLRSGPAVVEAGWDRLGEVVAQLAEDGHVRPTALDAAANDEPHRGARARWAELCRSRPGLVPRRELASARVARRARGWRRSGGEGDRHSIRSTHSPLDLHSSRSCWTSCCGQSQPVRPSRTAAQRCIRTPTCSELVLAYQIYGADRWSDAESKLRGIVSFTTHPG